MDMTKQKEQLGKVEKQISDYTVKLRSTEQRLRGEHESLRSLGSRRALTLSQLADASAEDAQRINKKLDEIESQMRTTERRAASLQALVKTINSRMAELTKEHEAVSQQIAQVENEKAFALERENLERGFADLGEMLQIVRERMADLNTKAASFGQRFSGAGYNVIAPLFDTFLSDQANQDQRGFKFAYGYRADFRIVLNPMLPK